MKKNVFNDITNDTPSNRWELFFIEHTHVPCTINHVSNLFYNEAYVHLTPAT